MKKIETLLVRDTFCKGDLVKTEGDTDRDLYILTRGSVSVKIMLPLSQVFQNRVIGALTENPHIS